MSQLIVIGYDDEFKAEEVRLKFLKLKKEYLVDLEDAVVAVKKPDGKVRLHQSLNMTAYGAYQGGFFGVLLGILFLSPLLGAAIGASTGAVLGALTDVGINDNFMKEIASKLTPGASVLFVLVRSSTPDKVMEELQGSGGTLLKTSLSHEDENKLQAALDEAKQVEQPVS